MTVQSIRLFGDPVLVTPASPVTDFDKELRNLVSDLTQTMQAAPGAGLAAPQIGVPLRVFVWDIDDELGHLVNPTLDLSEEMQEGEEGCLSFPNLSFDTPRAFRAVAKGFNMYGDPVVVEGTELLARCLQHETDHLNGVLFIDRMNSEQRKIAMKEIRESDWFGLANQNGLAPKIKISPHKTHGQGL
jgi:peptide deformylase